MGLQIFDSEQHPWINLILLLLALVAVIFARAFGAELFRMWLRNLTAGGTKHRTVGVVCLISGGVLSYLCYDAVQSARNGAPKVSLSMAGAILIPLALIIGLIYLVLGPRARSLMGTRQDPTFAAWVIGITALALGVMLYLGLRQTLEAQGYDFHGRW
jgi:hypothetical protein